MSEHYISVCHSIKIVIHKAPLIEVANNLRSDRMAVSAYLSDLETHTANVEPTIQALIPETDRWTRLQREADTLIEQFPDPANRPPLFGVPVGVKDIFHAEGFLTRAGSDLPPEELTDDEAATVTQLKEAGALVLGKTATTEFAYFEPAPTRNPHNPEHTPGGSSSGSAAAVAAGLCPLALGTQTIGSVIRPAAFCGIVGFKPSYGRISTEGVIPLSISVDHVGFFTQDVGGASVVAAVLLDSWEPIPSPGEQPVLAVPTGPYLNQVSSAALAAFDTQIKRLRRADYEVLEVDVFENIETVNERHERLVSADAALAHYDWYDAYTDRYAATTRELIEEGLDVPVREMARGRSGRKQLRSALHTALEAADADLWICPAAPGPAPEGIDTTGDPVMNLPWTHAGLPTIALPADETDAGLPLGVQCAARFGDDERLLKWAIGLERTLSHQM